MTKKKCNQIKICVLLTFENLFFLDFSNNKYLKHCTDKSRMRTLSCICLLSDYREIKLLHRPLTDCNLLPVDNINMRVFTSQISFATKTA